MRPILRSGSLQAASGLRLGMAAGTLWAAPWVGLAQTPASAPPSLGAPNAPGNHYAVESPEASPAAPSTSEQKESSHWMNFFQKEEGESKEKATPSKGKGTKNMLAFMNRSKNRREEYSADEQLDFLVALARFREGEGDADAAANLYAEALKSSPDNLDVLLAYARLLDRQNRLDEAIAVYQAATDKHPESSKAWNDLGLGLARAGQLVESKKSLYEAVQLQPENKRYRNNLATVLIELNQTDEALRELSAVHEPAVAHYNLGYLLQKRARLAEAREQFVAAAQRNPQLTEASRWVTHLDTLAAEHQRQMASQLPEARTAMLNQGGQTRQVQGPQAWPQAPLPGAGYGQPGAPVAQGWQGGIQAPQPQMWQGQGNAGPAPTPPDANARRATRIPPVSSVRLGSQPQGATRR